MPSWPACEVWVGKTRRFMATISDTSGWRSVVRTNYSDRYRTLGIMPEAHVSRKADARCLFRSCQDFPCIEKVRHRFTRTYADVTYSKRVSRQTYYVISSWNWGYGRLGNVFSSGYQYIGNILGFTRPSRSSYTRPNPSIYHDFNLVDF